MTGSATTSKGSVRIGNVMNLGGNGTIKKAAAGSTSGQDVKEVFYRVYFEADKESGRFVIQDVYADFVMTSGAGTIEQKFGISFQPVSTQIDMLNNKPKAGQTVYRSGNPGYENSSALIVGQEKSKTLPQKVNFTGFSMYGADPTGKCYPAATADTQYYPSVPLTWGSGSVMSCAKEFSSGIDFESWCTAKSTISSLKIVDQFLTNFLYLGIWGSVDVTNPNDFIKVIQPDPIAFSTPGVFNKNDNSCELNSGVEVEVIIGKIG